MVDEKDYQIEDLGTVKLANFKGAILNMILELEKKRARHHFKVTGRRIEQFSRMTNPEYQEALDRMEDVWSKMGIFNALLRAGAIFGDLITIGPRTYEFHDNPQE
jgi:Obg family GTPase CgtA-like protein